MYEAGGHDMGLHFFCEIPSARRCSECGHLLKKWDEDLTTVAIGRFRKYDVGASYDGIDIFSRRARVICEQSGMTGLQFTQLAHPELYAVRAKTVIQYDSNSPGTRLLDKCNKCGHFRFVGIGQRVALMPGSTVPLKGFARTDLEFAAMDEKRPLLICGDEAAKILKAAKLKGLELRKVKE